MIKQIGLPKYALVRWSRTFYIITDRTWTTLGLISIIHNLNNDSFLPERQAGRETTVYIRETYFITLMIIFMTFEIRM